MIESITCPWCHGKMKTVSRPLSPHSTEETCKRCLGEGVVGEDWAWSVYNKMVEEDPFFNTAPQNDKGLTQDEIQKMIEKIIEEKGWSPDDTNAEDWGE